MSAVDPAAVRAGDVLPPLTLTITRGGIVRYAGASTDFNPIHWSDCKARELGLPGVLAHGMWTMGASLRIITDWCADPRRVLDYQVRFTRPVQVPDDDRGVQVQVSASVTGVEAGVATVAVDVRIDHEGKPVKVLGNARAHIRL